MEQEQPGEEEARPKIECPEGVYPRTTPRDQSPQGEIGRRLEAWQNDPKFGRRNEPEVITPFVMEPDHPMMEKFQVALKAHLLRQSERLKAEVFELDTDIKKKETEREELGVSLYSAQQEVYKQQTALEEFQEAIEQVIKDRESLEIHLKDKRVNWKTEVEHLSDEKKKEMEMNTELNRLCALEKQFEKWEVDMDSELAVSQRIAEKTKIDRKQLIDEKRRMDMYLLRLMNEVTKFEAELNLLNAEIEIKEEEAEKVSQTVADANADLHALTCEQKRLFQAWNSVIVVMAQRDAIYANVSKSLYDCRESFRSLTAEIESYRRSGINETRKSEQLAILFARIEADLDNNLRVLKVQMDKKASLEIIVIRISAIIQQNEKELMRLRVEGQIKEAETVGVRLELEKLFGEKRKLEDEILSLIQEQIVNDKASMNLSRLFREIQLKSREMEMHMVESENKLSKVMLRVEEMKGIVARNKDILDEMNKDLTSKEQTLAAFEQEFEKFQTLLKLKQQRILALNKKIDKLLEQTGISYGQSPLEVKMLELEEKNAKLQEDIDRLQVSWLITQTTNVELTQQRNEQLESIHVIRNQVIILDQRILKLDKEVNKYLKTESDLLRSITHLQQRLESLCATLSGKREQKEQLDKGNTITQVYYAYTLKDAELEQLRLQTDIKDLEAELEELAETMLATQREMLAWEKKIKMALETKANILKEKSSTGEIGQMRSEIHRMEVRYSQLRKAQDKLIYDMEQCILRRDAILDTADAREKRAGGGTSTSRYNFQKKIDDLRAKIRQVQNEQKVMDKTISATEENQEYLLNQINEKTEQLREMHETSERMDRQLEDGQLHKLQNLEMLVRRQRKCKMYTILKSGKHRLLHRNELVLDNEMQTQRAVNANLIGVVESLVDDLPVYRYGLMKILNSLKAKPS